MSSTPNDLVEARNFYIGQATHPTQDWTGFCQMAFRMSYGVPALYGSAAAQWLAADQKVRNTDLREAPVGVGLCTRGSNPAGHIFYAARPFKSGVTGGWSNDLVRTGDIDKIARTAPQTVWGHVPLGWVLEVNEFELDLTHGNPPKPKQNKRYQAVEVAIHKIGVARDNAKARGDFHDVRLLNKELADLKALFGKIRHA